MQEEPRAPRNRRKDRKRGYSTRRKKLLPWNKGKKSNINEENYSSTSGKKLKQDYPVSNYSGYRIFDFEILKTIINDVTCCKLCGGNIILKEVHTFGFGGDYNLECQQCDFVQRFSNCAKVGRRHTSYELNRRAVLASRLVGCGRTDLSVLCGIMDLPPPVTPNAFKKIQDIVMRAASDEANDSMRRAVEKEIEISNELKIREIDSQANQLKVKGDGTWQKRGFQSLNGVVSVIGCESEKVIDIEVLTSHCQMCSAWISKNGSPDGKTWEDWYSTHTLICKKNYFGSSGGMESAGIVKIFKRSVDKYNVQYIEYIGDGDSKTFFNVIRAQPYGPNVTIKKIECIAHVGKRFGYHMRKLKENLKRKKLSDGKGLTGRGRLTDKVIISMQTYYTGAIRSNPKSLSSMIRDIWAIWYHMGSSDDTPHHQFCPVGRSSWCKYQRAKSLNNLEEFHHKNPLPKAVMDAIRPVFVQMTSVTLLKRCLGGHTQNSNESFNSILWKVCPKNIFVGLDTLRFGSQIATVLFNDGMSGILRIMERLNVKPGANAIAAAKTKDNIRIRRAEKGRKEDLKKKRQIYKKLNLQCTDQDGSDYEPGAY